MIRIPQASPDAAGYFVSFKAPTAIPVSSALARRALILATLDATVLSIRPAKKPAVALLHRVDGVSALMIHSGPRRGPAAYWDAEIAVEVVSATEIAAEPRLSNAMGIWSTRHLQVAIADTVLVLAHLDDGAVPLIEVARSVISTRDAVAAVFALACRGLVAIEMESEPIGPETLVRRVRKPA